MEAIVAAVALAALVAVLLVAGDRTRREGMVVQDATQLRMIGTATWSYAADHKERMWGFTWTAGNTPGSPFGTANSDIQAAADQAVWLMRELGGRSDINRIANWLPHLSYGHMTLTAYLGRNAPDGLFVSAGDAWRYKWAKNPACFDQGCFRPYQPWANSVFGDPNANKRWPYSASFQLTPAFWNDTADASRRIFQDTTQNRYLWLNPELRPAMLSRAAFPSQKVMLHDGGAWYFGDRSYSFLHPQAVLPVLTVDGHVQRLRTADANPGWQPRDPTNPLPSRFSYQPSNWEAPTTSGSASDSVIGVYRWTRGGIAGRDFGGPEVNTGHR